MLNKQNSKRTTKSTVSTCRCADIIRYSDTIAILQHLRQSSERTVCRTGRTKVTFEHVMSLYVIPIAAMFLGLTYLFKGRERFCRSTGRWRRIKDNKSITYGVSFFVIAIAMTVQNLF